MDGRSLLADLQAELRNYLIDNLAEQGLKSSEIAARVGLTKEAVQRRLRKRKQQSTRLQAIDQMYADYCLAECRQIDGLKQRSWKAQARVRAYGGMVDELVDLLAVIERDAAICHLCGQPVEPHQLEFDHVIPLVWGGAHNTANVRVAHGRCNAIKGARL